jgi:large subunit ribosomal protein L3
MNQNPGVIGRKLGMTQIFDESGSVVPCTVVEAKPIVVAKRTQEKDGYDALVLGIESRKEKHTSKPLAGMYKKQNVAAQRMLREMRCAADVAAKYEVGATLKLDEVFQIGQFVDVEGTTRGRGFTGVMVRHGFKGGVQTHGTHEYRRHGGAIGTNMTPGRTFPGLRMPGHYGNEKQTMQNQPIVKILPEEGVIYIRGGIPGAKNGLVFVRGTVKRRGKAKS